MLSPLKELFCKISKTNSDAQKVDLIKSTLQKSDDQNRKWITFFLYGNRLKRVVSSKDIVESFTNISDMPFWLFEESYASIGDLAETVSLLKGDPIGSLDLSLSEFVDNYLLNMKSVSREEKIAKITFLLNHTEAEDSFLALKLLMGNLKIKIGDNILVKAISGFLDVEENLVLERLVNFDPFSEVSFEEIFNEVKDKAIPYPFFLASNLDRDIDVSNFQFEWKMDGIRAQLIKCGKEVRVWSRNMIPITHKFPDVVDSFKEISSNFILDGEILVECEAGHSFELLQRRLSRKVISREVLENRATFLAFDILEVDGKDIRGKELSERRAILESLIPAKFLLEKLSISSIEDMKRLRRSCKGSIEGLMIKKLDSPYLSGRVRGHWWKYKRDFCTVDAVLVYAHLGYGKDRSLFLEYTFGLRKGKEIVPFTSIYSGLDSEEDTKDLDEWVRDNTVERFGPTRRVRLERVFEIAFENIRKSRRRKSGIVVKSPKILREIYNKSVEDIDDVDKVIKLMKQYC